MFLFITVNSSILMRLDRYLKSKYPKLTQGIIEKNIRYSNIKVDNKKCTAGTRVITGNIIKLPKDFENLYVTQKAINFDFSETIQKLAVKLFDEYKIYEDNKVLVINKPAGIASQQGSNINLSVNQALQYINYINKNNVNEFKLVHRLDRETSGIMVIAKNRASAVLFSLFLKARKIQKEYISFNWYEHTKKLDLLGSWEYFEDSNFKKGLTNFKISQKLSNQVCKIVWHPITGRKHQIRKHSYIMNFPIVGDKKYYYSSFKKYSNLLLHAKSIILPSDVIDLDYPIKLDTNLPHYFDIDLIDKYN